MILRRLVVVLGILSALTILVGTAYDVWRARTDALERAEARLADLALVLGEQTARAIGQVESVLAAVGEDVAELAAPGRLAAGRELHEQLRAHNAVPQVTAVLAFDAAGRPLASSRDFPAPAATVADREYFRTHRERVVQRSFVSTPFVGRVSGAPTVAVSSGVRNAAGELIGVVVAYLDPEYFAGLYRALGLGPGGGVRLFHRDGTMVAGDPVDPQAGAALVTTLAQRAIAPGTATILRTADAFAGAPGSIALQALPEYPFVLAVRSTTDHALAAWRREAWTTGLLGAIAAAVVLALTFAIERRLAADSRLRGELHELEARWRFALEGAEHGVFDWDLRAGRLYRSPQYLALLGYSADDVDARGPAHDQLIHPDDRDRARALWDGCTAGRIPQFAEEFRMLRKDGGTVPVLLSGMVVERDRDGEPTRLIGTVTDVSRLKAAQGHVREAEVRLAAIVQSAMDAIITVDAEQRIVLCNVAAERMFGCTPEEAIGKPLDRFLPERFRAAHRAHIERFGRTGETSRRMGRQQALCALRADGTEFPIEASISHATVAGQHLYTVILRDITARVKAEEELRLAHDELRGLAQAMHEVREAERTRIARELHDELGQALTALKMDVDLLGGALPADRPDLAERIEAMRGLLDSTVATTRRISADLRPLVLDDLGLGAAAEWLVQGFSQRTQIPCSLHVDPSCGQLGEPYASALFRIMQESLTNVARHARATKVSVRLERRGDDAVLTVLDDGVGMDRSARPNPRSFGLRGIGERALLLGGSAEIASRPGAGTTLVARIPLAGDGGRREAA
jgi:PAS domain S-box-containing protein